MVVYSAITTGVGVFPVRFGGFIFFGYHGEVCIPRQWPLQRRIMAAVAVDEVAQAAEADGVFAVFAEEGVEGAMANVPIPEALLDNAEGVESGDAVGVPDEGLVQGGDGGAEEADCPVDAGEMLKIEQGALKAEIALDDGVVEAFEASES